ncbi:MAG TPA: alpha/beta fold hydrolase [Acetobacteraceae bacterium]|nr:alpha/beta fold hydrolase [Acetobacteraceae bacterium]
MLRVGPIGAAERPVVEGLPQGVVSDLAWSADSARLALVAAGPTAPASLFIWESGAARPVWRPDPQAEAGIDPETFRPFELVAWESFDGARIAGWMARPAGPEPASGWPAIVWVHGGPASQTRANFRADMQMLLAHGYAVLMPNVRGSTGYGRTFTLSDEHERRLDSVRDLAAGAAWFAARPEIDAGRIAVIGQSYGGYMVNAAVTEHPELWRAAVSYYGIADFATLLANTGPWRRAHRSREYGDPDAHEALFARISPVRNIDRARAPLLLLHGRRDPRVPFSESEQMEQALRERQRVVAFETFDYAGHGFIRPDDRRRVYTAVAAFLATHMG